MSHGPQSTTTLPLPPARRVAAWWRDWRRMAHHRFFMDGVEHLDIRWRFRAVVMALGLGFLGYIVWSATEQATIEKNRLRDRALSLANLMSARLDDHVLQIDRMLAVAAYSVGTNIDDAAAAGTLITSMRSHVPASTNNIVVWSLAGDAIATLNRETKVKALKATDRQYFRNALATRTLAIEGPYVSRGNGEIIVQFARPIFDAKDALVGVISMSVRLRSLVDDLDPADRIGKDTLVTILDREGRILGRSIEPALWIGRTIAQTDRLADAFARKNGAREMTSSDGVQRLAGFSAASRVPWIVYAGEPLDLVLASVSERLLKSLGLGVAILVFAMLLAGRVASWTIKPLLRLAADTARLGAGDLSHRSDVVTGGEIAALAADFNRMAAALEERAHALAVSQKQVREIADHIPARVAYIDRDERYRFVNRYSGISGMRADEMLGRTVREVRGDAMYEQLAPHLRRALGGEANVLELTLEVDGRTTHLRIDHVPARDAAGEVDGVYAFTQDVTERKQAELEVVRSERRLVTITDNLPALVCYVDPESRFRFCNRAFEKWLRRPTKTLIGQRFQDVMPADTAAQFQNRMAEGLAGKLCEYEVNAAMPGGRSVWLQAIFIPDVDDRTGAVRGLYGMVHNVTAAKEAEHRLTRLAQFDTLTGLPNRHQFSEKLATALQSAEETGTPMALMFLDIDHFKQVNDRYGHGGGDALLKDFAQRLAECVRPTDAVARLAGDEFVILLEGLHSDDEPQFVARKIIAAVEKPFLVDDCYLKVTSSIGIAMRVFETDASMLMKRADEALYEAKRAGRNTFRLAS